MSELEPILKRIDGYLERPMLTASKLSLAGYLEVHWPVLRRALADRSAVSLAAETTPHVITGIDRGGSITGGDRVSCSCGSFWGVARHHNDNRIARSIGAHIIERCKL